MFWGAHAGVVADVVETAEYVVAEVVRPRQSVVTPRRDPQHRHTTLVVMTYLCALYSPTNMCTELTDICDVCFFPHVSAVSCNTARAHTLHHFVSFHGCASGLNYATNISAKNAGNFID
jgi:hypothetical protein